MTRPLLYMDNAATSWPKPDRVGKAMVRFLEQSGGNPGRSGHRLSIAAGRVVETARDTICELLGGSDPMRTVFGLNGTEAINLALLGLLRPGDHVITSSVEHNSVMRPLRALEAQGVALTVVPCERSGALDPAAVEAAIRPATTLIAMTHASNVVGTLLPVAAVGRIARRHSLLLLVDAAATAGAVPLDMDADHIDLLAFTGHKSLLGPTGTGGLLLGDRVDPQRLLPLKRGGTGSRSETEAQPPFLPDAYESGTVNAVGLAGLLAGIEWLQERGIEAICEHHRALTARLIDGLRGIPGVTLHGPGDADQQTAIVSWTLEGATPSEVACILDEEYGILCRVGLHCAPAAHRTMGTFPHGTVRLAPGAITSQQDTERVLAAVAAISKEHR